VSRPRLDLHRGPDARHPPASGAPVSLDHIDKQIIEQLQVDGRKPYAQLAPVVGLSEAAVRQRVQRLVEGGVMQVVAVTDPRLLGFNRQAMIGVNVDGDSRIVAEALSALDEVEYVVLTTGGFDLLVEVVVEDDEHLLELLHGTVRAVPGVRDTETFPYLRIHKETYQWGTR
jgi:Lrp/AsnC family transcriptional regulator, regulator for asnA, asnC and gidA